MMKSVLIAAAALLAILAAGGAQADLTVVSEHNGQTSSVYVAPHMFSGDMEGNRIIFRGDKEALWVLDIGKKSYFEITKSDMEAMSEKMAQARKQMEEAMKNMPEAQREQMMKMMEGRLPKMDLPEREVKTTGQSKDINGFSCDQYLVTEEGGRTEEVWSTDWKALKLDAGDLKVFNELAEFMSALGPAAESMRNLAKDFENPGEDDVPGIPILVISKNPSGSEEWRSEVKSIDTGDVDTSRFEIPEGFKKEASPMKM